MTRKTQINNNDYAIEEELETYSDYISNYKRQSRQKNRKTKYKEYDTYDS